MREREGEREQTHISTRCHVYLQFVLAKRNKQKKKEINKAIHLLPMEELPLSY